MPNGMANANITYKLVVGSPNEDTLHQLLEIYTTIFEDADINFFKERLQLHSKTISVLAYNNQNLIGLKLVIHITKTHFTVGLVVYFLVTGKRELPIRSQTNKN